MQKNQKPLLLAEINAEPVVEVDVKPVSDPLNDHLLSEIEITIL